MQDRIPYTIRLSPKTVYLLRAFAKSQRGRPESKRIRIYQVVEPEIVKALNTRIANEYPRIQSS